MLNACGAGAAMTMTGAAISAATTPADTAPTHFRREEWFEFKGFPPTTPHLAPARNGKIEDVARRVWGKRRRARRLTLAGCEIFLTTRRALGSRPAQSPRPAIFLQSNRAGR